MSDPVATVVVAAPNPGDRDWLRQILEESGEYRVVAAADDGVQAINHVVDHHPDVLVIDLLMKQEAISGLEIIPSVRSRSPRTVMVILAEPGLEAAVRVARRLGASAWITREQSGERVLRTVQLASGRELTGIPQRAEAQTRT